MEAGLRLAEDVVEPDITCNVKRDNSEWPRRDICVKFARDNARKRLC
jgi:hypothetical protein